MPKKRRKPSFWLFYLAVLFGDGGGIGNTVVFVRFSNSFNIKEIAFPSGTIIFVLCCNALVIVSSCLNVMAESLKYVVRASLRSLVA